MKKKENPEKQLLSEIGAMTAGGVGLGLGGKIIGQLPASGATTGVTKGLNTMGSFFPTYASISSGGYAIKKVKKLRRL